MDDTAGPRLAPTTDADWDDDTRALMQATGGLNIFTTLAHHPDLLRRWLVFGGHVLGKSTLPARERELVILRTGWRCHTPYEFGQHTLIAGAVGVTDDEIVRLTGAADDPAWSDAERTLLRAVDELIDEKCITDATWAALRGQLSTQQLIDLVFTVGQYTLVAMALNTFGVELDEGVPGFPG